MCLDNVTAPKSASPSFPI